jgi:hypothetical protein
LSFWYIVHRLGSELSRMYILILDVVYILPLNHYVLVTFIPCKRVKSNYKWYTLHCHPLTLWCPTKERLSSCYLWRLAWGIRSGIKWWITFEERQVWRGLCGQTCL